MIINTNPGAAMAARILGESSSALQKSLSRLSSGSKLPHHQMMPRALVLP